MILVTGARGVVGHPLVSRLEVEAKDVLTVSRKVEEQGHCLQWELSEPASQDVRAQLKAVDTVLHCAPIWLLPSHLETLKNAGVGRIIAFSSTSVLSKLTSVDQTERHLVSQLKNSEASLFEFCRANNIALTILRPSMIYGYGRDQNISHIASLINRFGFMLLVGKASGLRQPVHADDLVTVCLDIISQQRTFNKAYNLAGAEVLSYRDMVKRIFVGLNKKPRILSVPLWLFRPLLIMAAKLTSFSYTPEMANRMAQDLTYDYRDATVDFSYQPQAFLSKPERDLSL